MLPRAFRLVLVACLLALAASPGTRHAVFRGPTAAHLNDIDRTKRALAILHASPLAFEPESTSYIAHGPGFSIRLNGAEATFAHAGGSVVRAKLTGANRLVHAETVDELPGRMNHFEGRDPARWRTDIPTYAKIRYRDMYSGIDLVYYGSEDQLEYDFVVSPNADPSLIAFTFDGVDRMAIDVEGALVLDTGAGQFRQHAPVVYQDIRGEKRRVGAAYALRSDGLVGFAVDRYDARRPLVIDPVLTFSTYLGGDGEEETIHVTLDQSGGVYVAGRTFSTDFPATGGIPRVNTTTDEHAFVTKLTASGQRVYTTTICGGGDGGRCGAHEVAVDAAGNAYVTGATTATSFPATRGAFSTTLAGMDDAFVLKLNPTGTALMYATYLGGTRREKGWGIAVDAAGNAYVEGTTESPDFPTTPGVVQPRGAGGFDAFVAKLNPSGSSLVYSTFIGGSGDENGADTSGQFAGTEHITRAALALDANGNVHIAGRTASKDFPIVNGFQTANAGGWDAFVAKLDSTGTSILYSTYLGGGGDDDAEGGVVTSPAGLTYVAGNTTSADFPTASAIQASYGGGEDAFAAVLDTSQAGPASLTYSTFLGGSLGDEAFGIGVDAAGNMYVAGSTESDDFPTLDSIQVKDRGSDLFVAQLNPAGSEFVYSTLIGGSAQEQAQSMAVDAAGTVYVVGTTNSPNFPTAVPLQPTLGSHPTCRGTGCFDGFVLRLDELVVGSGSCGAPSAPTGLMALAGRATVTVAWRAGMGTPVSYLVEAGSAPGLSDLARIDTANNTTAMTVATIGPGTYYFRVRARNTCGGFSSASDEIAVRLGK